MKKSCGRTAFLPLAASHPPAYTPLVKFRPIPGPIRNSMLEYLRIRDLALIEDMELEFASGLNALTGETGAGKSFILKAIGFLTGDRLTTDLVRPGKEKAVAEAFFVMPDGTEHILRRELSAETGRSRIFANDKLISQDAVRDLRSSLIVHTSQHGQQQLLQPAFQAAVLDDFMDRPDLLAEREACLAALRDVAARREELNAKAAALSEKREILEFQQQEIDKVNPLPGEEETLETEREEARNAEHVREGVEEALSLLRGDGDGWGLLDGLAQLEKALASLARTDDGFSPDLESLRELHTGLVDLDGRLRRMGTRARPEADTERIEARLFALAQLKRKLRRSLAEILSLREEIAENISFLDSCELDKKQIAREEAALCDKLAALLATLNPARAAAAKELAGLLEAELRHLGFSEHVKVEFAFTPAPLFPGRDDCLEERARILWRPNPGQASQPLDKIASGGELSRFLLALVSLMSRRSVEQPVLIFDEVDSGVGGLTLGRVAERLALLAEHRQILLITHWPQLAARATRHFQVRKEVRGDDTFTLCTRLDEAGRRAELTRMAGGGGMGGALVRELMGDQPPLPY
ncbi:SMC domain protein [uncultured delta proteobacterium]|uniref:DNA repair protein RecN n=1 Tax=uncultured delta proteobacterium TaxID=34034 RepID=A0A212JLM4_9DELT|nr:SMC domain protein [uncultured delta proteobacterium]